MRENRDAWREAWLIEMAERARTLDELLTDPAFCQRPSEEIVKDPRYERWLKAAAAGDRTAFLRRLSWEKLGKEIDPVVAGSSKPAWVSWIDQVSDQASCVAAELAREGAAEGALWSSGDPIPFFELWLPFLRVARERLRSRAGAVLDGFTATALQDLERHLACDLSARGAWAAHESFDAWRRCPTEILSGDSVDPSSRLYTPFVRQLLANGLSDFLRRSSALARRLATAAARWVEATAELMERLANDRAELEALLNGGQALGTIVGVERLSEPHGGGRRVLALATSRRRKLVYKPRPVCCEAAFQDLLRWLAARGLADTPAPLKMVARRGYGWSAWIEPAAAKDLEGVERYFERAGALLCVVELLGGDDLHAENVVATAEGPVLVDAETLFQPLMEDEPASAPPRFRSQLATSPQLDAAGHLHDLGGLQGGARWLGEARRPVWRSVNTDAVSIDYQPAFVEPGANVLFWNGRPCHPESHLEALGRGFAKTYRFLLLHRAELLAEDGPLAVFRGASSRVVLRGSQPYAALVARLRQARFQGSGMEVDVLIETAARPFLCERVRPHSWDLLKEERQALREGDIPRFEVPTGDTRISLPGGRGVADCFSVSGFDAVRRRIRGLSEAGLKEWLKVLGRLWARPAVRRQASSGGNERVLTDPVALSFSIGQRILDSGKPGRARGLYEGRLGVAVFLAALACLTGERRFGETAAALALEDLSRPLPRVRRGGIELGSFAGLGGDLHASACIAHWLGDPAVADAAMRRLRQVGPSDLDSASPDLAAGLAGCVVGALAFASVTGEPAARRLAETAGERLAFQLDDRVIRQPGVAHGLAGISLAFLRLAVASGDRGWIPLARRAWEREWHVRAQAPGFLPALTRQGLGWCRGSSGLGLVALELLRAEPTEDRPLELTMAVAALRVDWMSDRDGLCCGRAGELELLLAARHAPGPPGLADRLEPLRTAWWRCLAERGPRLDTDRLGRNRSHSGLFRGSAGVGYQLLRTCQPERWPSILTFAPPSTADDDRRCHVEAAIA